MYIEIFIVLVYRQLFTFALLKNLQTTKKSFLTIVILNLYLILNLRLKSLIKYYYYDDDDDDDDYYY